MEPLFPINPPPDFKINQPDKKTDEEASTNKKLPIPQPETGEGKDLTQKDAKKLNPNVEEVKKINEVASTVLVLSEKKKIYLDAFNAKMTELFDSLYIEDDPEDKTARAKSQEALDLFTKNITLIKEIPLPNPSPDVQRFKEQGFKLERYPDGKLYARINIFLGKGAQKTVKVAVDMHSFAPAARASVVLKDDAEKALKNELNIQQMLKGPEFVNILATCTYIGKDAIPKQGIIMEYCEGGNLRGLGMNYYDEELPPTLQTVYWDFVGTLLSGLSQMEEKNIHHRDLKPENFMISVDEEGNMHIKIADFGFAITIEQEKLSRSFENIGTLRYQSPEFLKGFELIDKGEELIALGDPDSVEKGKKLSAEGAEILATTKGDVWAMGIILLELRTTFVASVEKLLNEKGGYRLLEKIRDLKQDEIFSWFSKDVSHDGKIRTLEDLNYMMLQTDPNKRISAKEALNIFKKLKQTDDNFCVSRENLKTLKAKMVS